MFAEVSMVCQERTRLGVRLRSSARGVFIALLAPLTMRLEVRTVFRGRRDWIVEPGRDWVTLDLEA